MDSSNYISLNKANWDERAPEHAKAPSYAIQRLIQDPKHLSDVVSFDIPLLGRIDGLRVLHLQCHIGTDTLSLARRGASEVVGVDFSRASLHEARQLASQAAGGERVSFIESDVYSTLQHFSGKPESSSSSSSSSFSKNDFDLVFTGVGALCWLPDIRGWARTVAALLKPGTGRLFLREGHPMLWAIDETVMSEVAVRYPYFEQKAGTTFEDSQTYVALQDRDKVFDSTKTVQWNHGLGEIVQALLDAGMRLTGLVEHTSIPWEGMPGRMRELENGEWVLKEHPERLPLSYTLQAVKNS